MVDSDKPKISHRIHSLAAKRKGLSKNIRRASVATVRHAHKFVIKRLSNIREVQSRVIVWTVIIGLLIAASGFQLVLYQRAYKTVAATDGGVYAEAVLGPADTLNPLFASSSAEKSAARLLFSRLYNYDTTGHLSGDLASSLEISEDGTIYTVKLRPDARWHDGYAVTAKDVEFTINLIKNPQTRSTISGWGGITVRAIDDTTVEFNLPAEYAPFQNALTFAILPEHILADIEPSELRTHSYSNQPIGSGPFEFRLLQNVDASGNHKIIYLTRNQSYYRGQTKLDRFQLHVYNNSEAIIEALATNEVNAASDLSMNDLSLTDSERYSVTTTPVRSGVYALFNTTSSILRDKTVRQALRYGTDTEAIRQKLPVSVPELDLPFIDSQLSGDIPKVPDTNVDEASRLLDQAGWKLEGGVRKKDGREMSLSIVTVQGDEYERTLEGLAGQWRQLGVVVDTQVVDPSNVSQSVVQNILQPRNYDVLIYQLEIGADPDVYAYWHSSQVGTSGYNFSNYSNNISDDALSSARQRLDWSLRDAKYVTFARQWIEDVPAIGLYQSTLQYAHGQGVQTFDTALPLVSAVDRYYSIQYWTANSRTVYKTP